MYNYSQVYAETLNEFESPYVPGDQGDAGKGQVNARAVYKINTTMNSNVGYITKTGGQTQYHGIAVDACQDRGDGYGADYLTDELQPDGRRLIKLAYTAYPTPASPPDAGWQQPTADMLEKGGPLVLKADSGGGTPPDPTPTPPATDYGPRFDAIDAQLAALVAQQANDTASIIMNDNANTEKIQTQIHDVIEDFEASAVKIGKLALLMRRINGGGSRSKGNDDAALDAAVADVEAWLATHGG